MGTSVGRDTRRDWGWLGQAALAAPLPSTPALFLLRQESGPAARHASLRVQGGRLGTVPAQGDSPDSSGSGKVFWLCMGLELGRTRQDPLRNVNISVFPLRKQTVKQQKLARAKSRLERLQIMSCPSPQPHPVAKGHRSALM